MPGKWMSNRFALVMSAALLTACSDAAEMPTAASARVTADPQHAQHMSAANVSTAAATDPFTFRAPLDAIRINQAPDFLMRSRNKSDIVFQRAIFNPGAGPWHTHPGPSFVYVIEGRIKVERVVKRGECMETPVHGPGEAYFEVGEQVHRAVVVSAEPAVLLVTRFNIPVGAPFTILAADPGC
jgi:hypothetical protein